ncbi:MAG: GNAT family N-acetyltransferase [Ardenticatenaceae bacterium]
MHQEQRSEEHRLTVEVDPAKEDVKYLRRALIEYNIRQAKIEDSEEVAVFVRDQYDGVVGGVCGWIWGACVDIDYFWVDPASRKRGYGRRLLRALEEQAMSRGCPCATLDTFTFQAPDFYEKMGYERFGVMEGVPNECKKF